MSAPTRDEIKAFFDQHDDDKSGTLEKNELPPLLKEIGLEGVQADQVLAAADENGDGKISFDEFCKLVGV
eukprot:CAMPEP_0116917350 /NCGR_PEP_ID=MMETSP0467-20121206/19087_1 /TAXON_ID=283647 /ORGANISM="Mesodinium pulex, Strain SPMC105" /LENGTH=69 /DNA_ID=CAMNT_0004594419 /DNA_START=9 /DNA_END=218 /DNA_ORIENTATION=+